MIKKSTQKVRIWAAQYTMVDNTRYQRGYTLPLLKCLTEAEAKYILKEIHEGVYGSHSGGRILAQKAVRAMYYWLGMNKDSSNMVKHNDKCQRFSKVITSPPKELSPASTP